MKKEKRCFSAMQKCLIVKWLKNKNLTEASPNHYEQDVNGRLCLEVLVHQVLLHDRFQEWRKEGVFKRMWIDGLSAYDENNTRAGVT